MIYAGQCPTPAASENFGGRTYPRTWILPWFGRLRGHAVSQTVAKNRCVDKFGRRSSLTQPVWDTGRRRSIITIIIINVIISELVASRDPGKTTFFCERSPPSEKLVLRRSRPATNSEKAFSECDLLKTSFFRICGRSRPS